MFAKQTPVTVAYQANRGSSATLSICCRSRHVTKYWNRKPNESVFGDIRSLPVFASNSIFKIYF